MSSFLSFHNYIEILALLIGIICWRFLKSTIFRWLVIFLLLIVLVEITGRYYSSVLYKPNAWLYNFSVPLEYLFFVWLLSAHYRSNVFKKIAFGFIVCFSIFSVLQIFVIGKLLVFNGVFLKIGSFSMLVFCCFYFIDFLKAEVPINPVTEPMFWIASGLFLFNAGEFLYVFLSDFLFSDWKKSKDIIRKINNNLIILLYITIAVGIINMAKKQWAQK